MRTEIKTITIALVLLTGIFLNILPTTTTTTIAQLSNTIPPYDNNPYSFQWWYSTPQHPDEYQPYDPDIDNDGKKKQDWIKQQDDDRKDVRYCANSGEWDGDKCIIEDEEEKAAYEDAVCDNPSDTKKYAKLCGGSVTKEDIPKKDKKTESTITVQPFSVQTQQQQQAINPHLADNEADDKIYQDFEKQYKAAHPEFYPEPKNPAAEPQESADRIMSYFDKSEHQEDNDDNSNDNDDTPRVSSDEASDQEEKAMKDSSSDENNNDDDKDDSSNDDSESDSSSSSSDGGDKDN